ncbi:hypothetical protein PG990_002392 [Apiospora arundinis]
MDDMDKTLLMTIVETFTPGLSLSQWSTIVETAGLNTSYAKLASPSPIRATPSQLVCPSNPARTHHFV